MAIHTNRKLTFLLWGDLEIIFKELPLSSKVSCSYLGTNSIFNCCVSCIWWRGGGVVEARVWSAGIQPVSCTCKACALPLEPHALPLTFYFSVHKSKPLHACLAQGVTRISRDFCPQKPCAILQETSS